MTDQTAARDRAINVVEDVVMGRFASMNNARRHAGSIVDALLARPEVLRALAGAPTADVASERAASVERMAHVEEVANLERHLGYARTGVAALLRRLDDLESKDRGLTYIDVAEVRRLLAAAPEGVDAADELGRLRDVLDGERGEHMRARDKVAALRAELTAAQAAIKRVQNEIDAVVAGTISPAVAVTNIIVRALDGDTTEEQR